ncbi:LysR family transcriptional regulator [Streptomyces sp. CBMA123]|uniref:LysR family transcriptional regulator n=1 Tax=Streptomyces sp. CBMA123 TaxID=1896313 RepID=UPI001661D3D6|nr:LysR substrate-binding domain-containing protein [Streptomyces sp. CBMA123]MBD0695945.1 LysR family transcriptional regulator [Streptomyces sp. CBMA123]
MDLDLRKLRYFTAVAERQHFGRAAEELHIAQSVLSRQIMALERELRAQLFVRTRRTTRLTAAGEQLLADAGPLLANAEAVRRRVALAAGSGPLGFVVGFMPGLIVTPAVRVMSQRHPELSVEVFRTGWDDQAQVIRDGRADVGYLRLPVDQRGLTVLPLLAEPRVAVLPADHRLAGHDAVTLADLAGEHLLQNPDAVLPPHAASALLNGRTRPSVQTIRTVEEKLEYVAAGHGFVVLPLSVATFYTRPDVTHLPVHALPPCQVALAWDRSRRSPLIEEFAGIAAMLQASSLKPLDARQPTALG